MNRTTGITEATAVMTIAAVLIMAFPLAARVEGQTRVISLLDTGAPAIPACGYGWVEDDVTLITMPGTFYGGPQCDCSGPIECSEITGGIHLEMGKLLLAWDLPDCTVIGAEVFLSESCDPRCALVEFRGHMTGHDAFNETIGGQTLSYGVLQVGDRLESIMIHLCDGSIDRVDLYCSDGCEEDGDGWYSSYCAGRDCDDEDQAVNPGAAEICADGVDNDCDGLVDWADTPCECPDGDGDGYESASCGGDDCDDGDPAVNPGAAELCDGGVDEDCDGSIDAEDLDCPARLALIRHKLNDNQYLNIYSAPTQVGGEINPLVASDVWIGNVGAYNEITHMAGGDVDGDGDDELILVRHKQSGVQHLTIYDEPTVLLGDINPLLASDKWIGKVGTDNQVTHLTAGDIDGDGTDELIFIRQRESGNQYLNIYYAPAAVAGELGPLVASDTWIGNLGDRSEIMNLAAGDIDGDGTDELIFVRNRQNDNQYLNIYDAPTAVGADINPMVASDLWIGNIGTSTEITHMAAGDTDGDGDDELLFIRHRDNNNQYLHVYDAPTVPDGEINPLLASDTWIGNVGADTEVTHIAAIR